LVEHHYFHPGDYLVCVRINYYGGCEAHKCKGVEIGEDETDSCHAHLIATTPSISSLERVFYTVTGGGQNNPPVRICYKFGDGSDTCIIITSATPTPYSINHTYPAPGEYRACVRVLFASGCVGEDCKEVEIHSLSGICGGYMRDSLINLHTYAFRGQSIHNPNDEAISYRWTYGDGTMGIGQQVVHSYAQPGIYRVCLLINTREGCEARICSNARVGGVTEATLVLTPNPVHTILHALFLSTHNETVTIHIINSAGVVVRTYTRPAVVGPNNWDFDLSSLLPGVYSFVVQSPNQFASRIFLKQ
jgi:hypothetical protein